MERGLLQTAALDLGITRYSMLQIMKMTRGSATSFKKLAAGVFPTADTEIAEKAVGVLLAIAPLPPGYLCLRKPPLYMQ